MEGGAPMILHFISYVLFTFQKITIAILLNIKTEYVLLQLTPDQKSCTEIEDEWYQLKFQNTAQISSHELIYLLLNNFWDLILEW